MACAHMCTVWLTVCMPATRHAAALQFKRWVFVPVHVCTHSHPALAPGRCISHQAPGSHAVARHVKTCALLACVYCSLLLPCPASSHPGVLSASDQELGAHTHVIVVCPSFNPCRLPLLWPCAADTKQSLFASKQYHALLEKFSAMHSDKNERAIGSLFSQLDFIKGSLASITPGGWAAG